ncbi:MAG TPA: 2-hydroxychromene-2-carboxylate isomerase [Myxococcaceae bacterium]|nr:2-hydroxychromene-2-carboxylate isomerase [Myxococcaceae bacterium]
MSAATIDFWFDLASPYSALAALRIADVARGLDVRWHPFLLGPIFQAQGWNDSPFNLFPAKGRWMWRDVPRRAARRGITVRQPSRFPRHSVLASRVALVALGEGWGEDCVRATYRAEFAGDADIADPGVMAGIVSALGREGAAVVSRAVSQPVKDALRAATEQAARQGIFGAPTFLIDGELFWGDDRLEDAVAWARGERVLC